MTSLGAGKDGAFEKAGVEVIAKNGGGPRGRLRKDSAKGCAFAQKRRPSPAITNMPASESA